MSGSTLSIPPATENGPVIEVDADVQWIVEHPGCSRMSAGPSSAPQVLRLTGPRADSLRHEVERGQRVAAQRLHLTGYVAAAAELTTVCGTWRPFMVIEVR